MKLLVTGANGFIGSNLCQYLITQKIFPRVLFRKSGDFALFKQLVPQWNQLEIKYGDLLEPDTLRPAVQGMDYIIHLAGTIKGSTPQEFNDGNCIGTKNLLDICLEECSHLKRLVHVSSMVAGGPGTPDCPACEDAPSQPLDSDWYGISKYNAECMSKKMLRKLPIVMVRPPMVVGPGDKISFDLFSLAKSGIKLYVSGTPRHFSVVHVEDLVKGIFLCATHPDIEGETFNFASKGSISYRDLHEVIATKVFQRKYGHLIPIPIPPAAFYAVGYLMEMIGRATHQPPFLNTAKAIQAAAAGQTMSAQKARLVLGWTPQHSIITALEHAGRWYQRNNWI